MSSLFIDAERSLTIETDGNMLLPGHYAVEAAAMKHRIAAIIASGVEADLSSKEIAAQVLAEMREPTDAMKAVEGVHWGYHCHVCGGLQEGWQAMIDEALK